MLISLPCIAPVLNIRYRGIMLEYAWQGARRKDYSLCLYVCSDINTDEK